MAASNSSIFVSRLHGLPVVDTNGDRVGKLRDVVIQPRLHRRAPRVKGLVVELFAHHRIFVPMLRVHNIDAVQVVISGVVNTRRFERWEVETLVVDNLFDSRVDVRGQERQAFVFDVAIKEVRAHEWAVSEVALRDSSRSRFGRGGHDLIVDWSEVMDFQPGGRSNEQLLARMEDMKAADIARELHDMSTQRRSEVVAALDDETLADAVEELPEDEQIQIISNLATARAAVVLAEMDPDDAADLLHELTPEVAEVLLAEMEPKEAQDVRRLLAYEEDTAGGLMTPEPVICSPDDTVATALAKVRTAEHTPALAAMVYVCRSPLETPTGHYLGAIHFQRLLREPPSLMVSRLVDSDLQPLVPDMNLATVSRYLATYNLVNAPVVQDDRLVGAVTVDDVLDHLLPEDWRGDQMDGMLPEDSE